MLALAMSFPSAERHRTAPTGWPVNWEPTRRWLAISHMKSVAQKLNKAIARADDFFTTEQVVDEVWTASLKTKLVIADCTGRSPNVFYELGLEHAIGKPTIVITQNHDDVPFDIRAWRYIA